MVDAVGMRQALHIRSTDSNVSRPAGLDADLAKWQGQLADWVNCVSAKTPEGKAKIDQISAKISSIKTRMKEAEKAREPDAASKSGPLTPTSPARLRAVAGADNAGAAVAAVGGEARTDPMGARADVRTLGSMVDVFV